MGFREEKMAASSAPKRQNENSETPAAKKIKLEEEVLDDNSSLQSFGGFKVVKVLNENAQTKSIVIHGELQKVFMIIS